jgi:flagellar basal body-associated protein FliL
MSDDFSLPNAPMEAPPKKSNTTLIIVIVVLALLLCCCAFVLIMYFYLGDVLLEMFEGTNFSRLLSLLPV